jgi:hypothetical protein
MQQDSYNYNHQTGQENGEAAYPRLAVIEMINETVCAASCANAEDNEIHSEFCI